MLTKIPKGKSPASFVKVTLNEGGCVLSWDRVWVSGDTGLTLAARSVKDGNS